MGSTSIARSISVCLLVGALVAAVLVIVAPAPAGGAAPGANGKIAFTSDRDGRDEIYVMDADGANPMRLTQAGGSQPAWSPDGLRLAFVGDSEIYTLDAFRSSAAGANPVNLGVGTAPAWSPDGTEIAFAWQGDIYVMSADGSGRRRLTESAGTDGFPAWSPQGSLLIFRRGASGPTPLAARAPMYVIAADGSAPPTLLIESFDIIRHSDWSPDGTRIAYEVDRFPILSTDIVTAAADGTAAAELANPLMLLFRGHPSWSPDGSKIAMDNADAADDVFVIAADGTGAVVNLTDNAFRDREPAWQPQTPIPYGLVDPASGLWHLRDTTDVREFYFGDPGDVPMLGDWNCDGIDTPGLYRQSDGFVYLRNSNSQGIADLRFFFGNPGDLPLAGDFDGDGCDTVSVHRPSEGRVFIINELGADEGGLGAADVDYFFGNPGDKPFVGDFDGDGIDTVGLHRESTGFMYFRQSHTAGVADAEFFYGNPGDRVIAGNWTGGAIDTVAVFRPGDGRFYIRNSNSQGVADAVFTALKATWLPVAGDFGFG